MKSPVYQFLLISQLMRKQASPKYLDSIRQLFYFLSSSFHTPRKSLPVHWIVRMVWADQKRNRPLGNSRMDNNSQNSNNWIAIADYRCDVMLVMECITPHVPFYKYFFRILVYKVKKRNF